MVKRFEDLIAWQKAQDLSVEVYIQFRSLKNYSFRDQICRPAVSVSNNIAEGFDRSSNQDFVRFLYMAAGSASEVRSMLYLARRLDYINCPASCNESKVPVSNQAVPRSSTPTSSLPFSRYILFTSVISSSPRGEGFIAFAIATTSLS